MFAPLFIAFAMYSKIPVPQVQWSQKNMRYAMCFFSLVGVVIGTVFVGIFELSTRLAFGGIARAAMLTVVPVFITGGIHADGFIDTADAISSYASREKRLEILKDPHVGAFGVLWIVIYFILYFGFCSEISKDSVLIVGLGFIFSRILSGYGAVTIPKARKDGLLTTFAEGANKKIVKRILSLMCFVVALTMLKVNFTMGLICAVGSIIVYYAYKAFAMKTFGGVTGDLAGFFLQICELAILILAVVVDKWGM